MSDDTQPKKPTGFDQQLNNVQHPAQMDMYYDDGLAAPPQFLLWGVIFLFMLGVIGTLSGVVIFREVLTPGQQVRVISYLPFMEALLPARPGAGDTIAPASSVDEEAAQSLLTNPLILPTNAPENSEATVPELTQEITPEAEATAEAEEAAVEIAAAATEVAILTPSPTNIPSATPIPPTPTQNQPTTTPTTAQITVDQTPPAVAMTSAQTWQPSALLGGIQHSKQTWNNCGPANVTMALSYYGWTRTQEFAASYLKPDDEDKNVSPHELVRFVNEQSDINALARMGGNLDLLRTLISNNFPVIIERSHMFEGYEWIGHYQTIAGYNDSQQVFTIYDSFLSDGDIITETYREVDDGWQDFNRLFIVIYEPQREATLMQLLGNHADPLSAAEYAFATAQEEARANPLDAFAWFNMGTSLTELGRFREAEVAYDKAFDLGLPWRMLWYQFGPFEAYYEVGRYQDVLNYVNNNLSNGGEYVEETYYWQGRALAALGRTAEAGTAFRNAVNRNRLFQEATDALNALNS